MPKKSEKLFNENTSQRKGCNLCKDAGLSVGKKTGYGLIIYKIGNQKNGWFATLSPRTGGNPEFDFTIQLMPVLHLTHFSQIDCNKKLAENFGASFSKISRAMTSIMMADQNLSANSEDMQSSVPIALYGKCTTWKEKKEHLHIKVFPFRGSIGQPYTVDSSFERKEVFKENAEEYVKMKPVKKVVIASERFEELDRNLIKLLKK